MTLESLVIIGRINKAVKKLAQDGKLDAAEFPLLMHMDAIIEGKATSEEIPVGGSFESPRQTLRIRLRPQIFRKT